MTSLRRHVTHSRAAGLLASLLVVAVGFFGLWSEQRRHLDELRSEVVTTASRVRADLEKALEQRIFMVEGLAGFAVADLAADSEIDGREFIDYATLLAKDSGVPIRSLQLAPGGIVTHIFPQEGNEAAMGHDLLEDQNRRAAVMEAVELRRPMVAGPFELLQGGLAIVVRKPVFWPSGPRAGEWWGLATMVADVPPLFSEVGLDGLDPTLDRFDIALRGADQSGAAGAVFHGDEIVFSAASEPVLFEVTLPTGTWQLGMVAAGGWSQWPWPRRTAYLLTVLAAALLLGGLVSRYAASRSEARRSAAELAGLVEAANAPIADFDADWTIVRWNHEMADLMGLHSRDVVGRRAFDANGSGVLARTLTSASHEQLHAVLLRSDGAEDPVELLLERRDGSATPVLMTVASRPGSRDRRGGIVIVCQDISARLDAERIEAESRAIERTARLKDEFLASMSHELRTPLNGIIGLSSILAKRTFGPLNDKQTEYVGQIATSGRHLLSLINDVLDLAKIEANQLDLDRGPVDLGQLASDVAKVLGEAAGASGHRIRLDLPGTPLIVSADARRLKQVILNLLSNAIKFTPADGHVGIIVRGSAEGVHLEVWDTGIGIPKDKQALLFQPFQQIDSSLNRTYEGTGLGLALTSELAALHGGSVSMESSSGNGARFIVRLPGSDVIASSRPDDEPASEPPRERPVGRRRVLVAEDNDLNRRMLVDLLRAEGLEVIEAVDGIEAVDKTRAFVPDLVLMDIQMPRRDGLAAIRLLKADDAVAHIPIVAVTALAMTGDADRCLAAGCDAYVSKPIEPDDLVTLVLDLSGATNVT